MVDIGSNSVRLVVYVTDMFRFRPLVNKIQAELWGAGPYPPRTIVGFRPIDTTTVVLPEGLQVNIDTDNRMAMTGAVRKALMERPGEFDPRYWMKPAKEAMKKLCMERYQQFGCEGQASSIRPMSTAQMAKRYAKGDLDPVYGRELKAAS